MSLINDLEDDLEAQEEALAESRGMLKFAWLGSVSAATCILAIIMIGLLHNTVPTGLLGLFIPLLVVSLIAATCGISAVMGGFQKGGKFSVPIRTKERRVRLTRKRLSDARTEEFLKGNS